MIRLLALNAEVFADDDLFAYYLDRLSPTRREKVRSLRFRKDQNLSLGAGVLLDYALRQKGRSEAQMTYGTQVNGKPFFNEYPSLRFNLSHSMTKVIAAFSDEEIGCDIEAVKPVNLTIARRFFHPNEYALICAQDDPSLQEATFFRFWTLKESFMKVTGLGLRLPMDQFEILLDGPQIRVRQSVDDRSYIFQEYDVFPGFCCALCRPVKTVAVSRPEAMPLTAEIIDPRERF